MRHALVLVLAFAITPVVAENLIGNPGFEGPAGPGLAEGWRDNTWGDTKTVYAIDSVNPHSGKTSQRVEGVRGQSGASQFLWPIKLQAKQRYHVQLWVRAEGRVPSVGVCLRQGPEPYRHYLPSQITPTRQWQLLDFSGFVPVSDDTAGLYIWFEPQSTGTVWVDDALVGIVDPTAPQGLPPTGNVIPNGSFELDTRRTWDGTGMPVESTPWPAGLATPPADGSRAMRAKLEMNQSFRLTTPCLPFNGNNLPLTLACSARATGGPVSLTVALHSADRIGQPGDMLRLDMTPGETLQRHEKTGQVPCSYVGAYYVTIEGKAEQPAEVWFDAVSLSPKGAQYEPAAKIEAALSCDTFANVFAPNEPVKVHVQALCRESSRGAKLRLEVRDCRERLVCQAPVTLPLKSDATLTDVVMPVKELGAFRADLFATGQATPLCSMVFSRIPLPKSVPAAQSNIGGHFSTESDWQMQIARRLGYKWTRIHDCSQITHWRTAEPKQGEWHFFDDQVARVKAAGLEILGEFLRVPDWATTAEPGTQAYQWGVGPYRDQAEFENYVRTVVSHYQDLIHYWEIWNEPYGSGFYGGTPEQYAALAQAAARAAKAANPSCQLLAPCTYPGTTEWTDRVLAAGGLSGADIFSYHGYGCLTKSPYDNVARWAVHNAKPISQWNTETGITADTFYRHTCDKLDDEYSRWAGHTPVEEAVIQSLKLFVLAIAGGADRYFYYWTNVEPGMCPRMNSMSIYEYDRTIRPHGVVYATAASLVDPSRGAGVKEYQSGVTACYLQHGADAVTVLWQALAGEDFHADLRALPKGTRLLDAMGNAVTLDRKGALDLGRYPIYVMVPKMRAADLALRLETALNRGPAHDMNGP